MATLAANAIISIAAPIENNNIHKRDVGKFCGKPYQI